MPVSKRSKKVSLTKVKKRNPPQARATYVDTLRSAVEQAPALYLIGIDEFARPTRFKQLRAALPQGSTLLLGKKTLMKVALGDSEENELKDNMRLFAEKIEGGDALPQVLLNGCDVLRHFKLQSIAEPRHGDGCCLR